MRTFEPTFSIPPNPTTIFANPTRKPQNPNSSPRPVGIKHSASFPNIWTGTTERGSAEETVQVPESAAVECGPESPVGEAVGRPAEGNWPETGGGTAVASQSYR